MIHETFAASSPKGAYELAVQKYGEDIELISARQIKYDDGHLRCEVIIAVSKEKYMDQVVTEDLEDEDANDLMSELSELRYELAQMKEAMLQEHEVSVAQKIKTLFMHKGIAEVWLDTIFASLKGNKILKDESLLITYLLEEIDESVQVQKEVLDEPKIIMLVGSTGVGKTTTIAKLAARYAFLMDKSYKVALINLDSYKVGAHEQLAHYANIMKIEHFIVENPEAFMQALAQTEGYDVVFVDTTGMSPYDTQKFIKAIEFLQSGTARKLEVSLVLSATVKYEDMNDTYTNFSFLNLDSLIITKFDETKHFGVLLNFMLLYKTPMSYFSIGQEVPDDLIPASKEYLLEQFIGDLDEA
jgi:flagellar biosynthesis protein FlhF